MATERPRFRVNALSFIGHSLCQPGAEVFYTPTPDGGVSENLSPLNDAAQEIVDKQKRDHPDKTANAEKKAKAAKTAEAAEAEQAAETTDGLLPKGVKPKGDTRSKKPPAAGKGKKGQEPAQDADEGGDGDKGDADDDIA